ncbi:putative AlkP superfamily pyrophosphatase or phosphodiesterase [Sinobacterium caligoides]|uniref:Putative AlkP superfamily pyrophosphatase or phosphodiesterase n=1 Tax=Sinobacterium caligoides TaxID=933926 RepID=A0A3N2DNY5_9GAMM|nr:alkaline phosphatase family protein [Sinobacterium caligoides]ROS01507.1 putative AlkP superfamily pyrophosphatase or phosphodiesterase [Sinobacterium caligoides]
MENKPLTKYKRISIFTFVDAFGWEIYRHYDFMNDRLPHAKRLNTVFGYSSAALPSILTGRYPREHKHWSSFYYAPKSSPFKHLRWLSPLPAFPFNNWRVRNLLSRWVSKREHFTGYFELYNIPFKKLPYFDYVEKNDYFQPGGIVKTDTIFDWCEEHDIHYYCAHWSTPEQQVIDSSITYFEARETPFIFLYLPKLDAELHRYGTRHQKIKEKISFIERNLNQLINRAENHYEEVNVYTFSDHGMADVTTSIDLIKDIETLGLVFGVDYAAMYDSTMARFWFLNKVAERSILQHLKGRDDGGIVSEEQACDWGVNFDDHQFGDCIYLLKPGSVICPSYMGKKALAGMHGYHPDDKDSYAFICSNLPLPKHVDSITDIRSLMQQHLQ